MTLYVKNSVVSDGWTPSQKFGEQGGVVSVAAGAGVLGVPAQLLVARSIPPANRAVLWLLDIRLPDGAGYDQMIFSLWHSGRAISPWDQISGTEVQLIPTVDVAQEFGPGALAVYATNISGTAWPGAGPAGAIRAIARLNGQLLNQS